MERAPTRGPAQQYLFKRGMKRSTWFKETGDLNCNLKDFFLNGNHQYQRMKTGEQSMREDQV